MIAAGKTGGHIYPALAIAQALQSRTADVKVDFVSTGSELEESIFSIYGFPVHKLKVGALNNASFILKLIVLFLMPFYILKSIFIILKSKTDLGFRCRRGC